jgi:hypothetical protein
LRVVLGGRLLDAEMDAIGAKGNEHWVLRSLEDHREAEAFVELPFGREVGDVENGCEPAEEGICLLRRLVGRCGCVFHVSLHSSDLSSKG